MSYIFLLSLLVSAQQPCGQNRNGWRKCPDETPYCSSKTKTCSKNTANCATAYSFGANCLPISGASCQHLKNAKPNMECDRSYSECVLKPVSMNQKIKTMKWVYQCHDM
eukprot:NODE_171_length_14381_cov_0.662512.p13 type:complete len:109 gc:universal NODE_171_length_14381_cov_0.662512:10162-10488(+)